MGGDLLVVALASAPASPLVPVSPQGVGPPAWSASLARALGLDALTRGWLTALSLALLACLVAAFAVVAWEAWRGRVRLGPVVAAGLAGLIVVVCGPLLLSRDVYSYAVYGRMVALYDVNPFVATPAAIPGDPFTSVVSGTWLHTPSLYGPAFTLIASAITRLWSSSAASTILAFKLLAAAGLGAVALCTVSTARRLRPDRAAFGAAVVLVNPVLVLHTVGGGHNDALLAAGLAGSFVLGTRLWLSGRSRAVHLAGPEALAVTALLALTALIKVVAGIALLVWLAALVRQGTPGTRWRVGLAHTGTAAGVVLVVFAPFLDGWRTLGPLVSLASVQGWASGPGLVIRGARALGEAMGGGVEAVERIAAGIFLGIFAVMLWRILRRALVDALGDQWGRSLLLFALAAPYLAPWYAAWFLPFVPFLADSPTAWIALAAGAILALTGVPAEPAGEPNLWSSMLLAVHYVAAPAMLLLFGATLHRERRRDRPPNAGQEASLSRA